MFITNSDLPALTVAELNRAYEDLTGALADYTGVHGDRLHARLQAIVDQLRARAAMEDAARGLTESQLVRAVKVVNGLAGDVALATVTAAALVALQDELARRDALGKQLYPRERLEIMADADLQSVLDFAAADAREGNDDVVYGGMNRAETIATARRTVTDVKAEIARRANAEAAE